MTIRISINTHCRGKDTSTIGMQTWVPVSVTPEALIENHYIAGVAIAPGQFTTTRKANNTWAGAQLLVLDIDQFPNDTGRNWTLARLLQHPIIAEHAVAIIPSSSYTPDTPKVHIYFPTNGMLTSIDDYRAAYDGLVALLTEGGELPPIDMALRNPAQAVFGTVYRNIDATPALNDGLYHLNPDYQALRVSTLLDRSPQRGADGSHGGKVLHHKDMHKETPEGLVEAILGAAGLTGDANTNGWYDKLECPFHDHSKSPNTFGINAESGVGHCFAADGVEEQASFSPFEMAAYYGIDMAQFYKPADPLTQHAITVNEQYLSPSLLRSRRSVAIKSNMGTGKTEVAGALARETMQAGGRVVAITHRVSLAGEMATRLGLQDYRSTTNDELEDGVNVAICVNSIRRMKQGSRYPQVDTIIVDEVEQVLAHITGGTFAGNESSLCHQGFESLVRQAKTVVIMDAHLTQFAVDWLTDLRDDVDVIVNTYQKADLQWVKFHNAKKVEEAALRAAVKTRGDGRPVMFAGGQNAVAALAEQARTLGLKAIHINGGDGGNVDFPEIADIVDNLNERLPEYDLVAYSPVLGSGVDITIPITALYGVMPGSTLTATEFAQLLGRCRKADVLNVYVPDTSNGNRPTREDVIYQAGIRQAQASAVGIMWDGVNEIITQDTMHHHKFVSRVIAKRNHELNWIGPAWYALYGDPMAVSKAEASEAHRNHSKAVKGALRDARIDAVVSARQIDAVEYADLQSSVETLSEADQHAMTRYRIERATGVRATRGIVDLYIGKINGLYNAANVFLVDDVTLQIRDHSQIMDQYDLHQRDHVLRKVQAVRALLSMVWGNYNTVNLNPIDKDHITLAAAMWASAGHGDAFYGGVRKAPKYGTTVYKNVLEWVGLSVSRRRIRNEEGDRVVVYTLTDSTILHMRLTQAGFDYRNADEGVLIGIESLIG